MRLLQTPASLQRPAALGVRRSLLYLPRMSASEKAVVSLVRRVSLRSTLNGPDEAQG